MRVGLISCSSTKLGHAAPARELYTGRFFTACRDWMTVPGRVGTWAILSAKHGLLMPDEVIEPYDCALATMRQGERDAWAVNVRAHLLAKWGQGVIYMVLAGGYYRDCVRGMPMVEDVIGHWAELRRLRGMGRPGMGIGVILRELRSGRGF